MMDKLEDLPRVDLMETLTALLIVRRKETSISKLTTIDFYIKKINHILSTTL